MSSDEEYNPEPPTKKRRASNTRPTGTNVPSRGRKKATAPPDWDSITDPVVLRAEIRRLEAIVQSQGKDLGTPMNPAELDSLVAKAAKSLHSQAMECMQYHGHQGSSTRGTVKGLVPNFQTPVMEKMFAAYLPRVTKKPKTKPKEWRLPLNEDEWEEVFGRALVKSLRYGATLEPHWPLTIVFSIQESLLKVTGSYSIVTSSMHKAREKLEMAALVAAEPQQVPAPTQIVHRTTSVSTVLNPTPGTLGDKAAAPATTTTSQAAVNSPFPNSSG
eukprot:TRINITY_DN67071_c1_g4_i4.p1 TRINITY_DN67071_c1_g4~~TRINITY_DN67071_c1_g4_i4.p1  ORF type:complete len:273 (-),score=30.03 TRINITY_DN67071_c1_g4_i4:55-873(-)